MAISEALRAVLVEKMTDEFGTEDAAVTSLATGPKPLVQPWVIRSLFNPDAPGATAPPDYIPGDDNGTMRLCHRYKIRASVFYDLAK